MLVPFQTPFEILFVQ